VKNSLGTSLALVHRVEPLPIFFVLLVKLPDGLLLVRVEVKLFYGHLKINDLAGNAGK
jgi:hypothetical protein